MNREENINSIKTKVNKLNKFICPDYPDLEINSKQYYRNVISNFFNGRKDFSYMYFDFDKLSIINNMYGRKIGDKLLKESLTIIKNILPPNAIISRLAGDEFCVIFPGINENEAQSFCKKIDSTLSALNEINHSINPNIISLAITSAIVPASLDKTIDEIEKLAENKCSIKKQEKKSKEQTNLDNTEINLKKPSNCNEQINDKWTALNLMINNCIKEHLRDIRPSDNFVFNLNLVKQEAFSIVSILGRLIESSPTETEEIDPSIISTDFDEEDTQYIVKNFVTNRYLSSIIFDLFNTSDTDSVLTTVSDNYLKNVNNGLSELSDYIIRDPHSNLLSKPYLKIFLADRICNSDCNYQAIYFSAIGIRPSNTAYGHTYTDMRIAKTAHSIVENSSDQFKFNNEGFSFDRTDSFLIDQGGGNYLALIPSQNALDEKTISEIVAKVNSIVNIDRTNSSFNVSFSVDNNINTSNSEAFFNSIRTLKETANKNKDVLKQSNISSIDMQNALKKSLIGCAKFYVDNIENASSIVNKNIFLTNIFSLLLHHEYIHNQEVKNKKEQEERE